MCLDNEGGGLQRQTEWRKKYITTKQSRPSQESTRAWSLIYSPLQIMAALNQTLCMTRERSAQLCRKVEFLDPCLAEVETSFPRLC